MALKFLRLPQVCERRGLKPTRHYADIKSGTFVPPIKLTERSSGWPEHECEALIAAKIAGKTDDELRELVRDLVAARRNLPAAARQRVK